MPIHPRFNKTTNTTTVGSSPAPTATATTSTATVKRGLEIYSGHDVTPGLDEFIGQEMAVKQIRLAVASAKGRNDRLPHTLLASGLAGIGKTTLAMHIAYEMGVGFVECSGKIDAEDVQRLVTGMSDGDILFIDECHTLGKGNSSAWVLPLLQDGVILTPQGRVEIPDITIVGATTDQGKLSEAMLSRFFLKPRLTYYELDEAALIVELFAIKMGIDLSNDECDQIAEAANRNPRAIKGLMTIVRDLFVVYGKVDMDELYALSGVTVDGLSEDHQGYLRALSGCTNMQASVNTLCAILGETGNIGHIEKDLMAKGYIEVMPRGRKLTMTGMQRVKSLR